MKKILAFGASNSKHSINKQFATFAANEIKNTDLTIIDLNDFAMPVYGVDLENESGIPEKAHAFLKLLKNTDGIIISLAEHNGNVSAIFKNITDWTSRLDGKWWQNKPMFLLSTSPGGRGGASVMEICLKLFPYRGGNIVAHFSLPFFNEKLDAEKGITDEEIKKGFEEQLAIFEKNLFQ